MKLFDVLPPLAHDKNSMEQSISSSENKDQQEISSKLPHLGSSPNQSSILISEAEETKQTLRQIQHKARSLSKQLDDILENVGQKFSKPDRPVPLDSTIQCSSPYFGPKGSRKAKFVRRMNSSIEKDYSVEKGSSLFRINSLGRTLEQESSQ